MAKEETIKLGRLEFHVSQRNLGADGGPSIEIYGHPAGKRAQVLRFDCFRRAPHYHLDPEYDDEQLGLDPAEARDPLAWALLQIRENIPDLLRTAGYEQLAVEVDATALQRGWVRVKEAVERTAPGSQAA